MYACWQNNYVWASGHKTDVDSSRLIFEKFARHIVVAAGISCCL